VTSLETVKSVGVGVLILKSFRKLKCRFRWQLCLSLFSSFVATSAIASFSEFAEKHITQPYRDGFDTHGLLIAGGGLLGVAATQTQDYNWRADWANYNRMSHQTARVGDYLGMGLMAAVVGGAQLLWDNENAIHHIEALAHTFVVTSILKQISNRARPASSNHHSMPSGHTSIVFATASHLAYAYGWKAAIPAYLAATFVAASRWSDDAHWLSDTVGGAGVGIFFGRATYLDAEHDDSPEVWLHWINQGPFVSVKFPTPF